VRRCISFGILQIHRGLSSGFAAPVESEFQSGEVGPALDRPELAASVLEVARGSGLRCRQRLVQLLQFPESVDRAFLRAFRASDCGLSRIRRPLERLDIRKCAGIFLRYFHKIRREQLEGLDACGMPECRIRLRDGLNPAFSDRTSAAASRAASFRGTGVDQVSDAQFCGYTFLLRR